MMRTTPLAVWGSGLTKEELREVVKSEVGLTHPNSTSADTVYIYNFAIKFLLDNKEDPEKTQKCMEACLAEVASFKKEKLGSYQQDIQSWLIQSVEMYQTFKETNEEALV